MFDKVSLLYAGGRFNRRSNLLGGQARPQSARDGLRRPQLQLSVFNRCSTTANVAAYLSGFTFLGASLQAL